MNLDRLDFDVVMGHMTSFKQGLRDVHGRVTQPKQKEILGQLIDKIDTAHAEVLAAVPAAFAGLRTRKRAATQKLQELKAKVSQQEQKAKQIMKQADDAKKEYEKQKKVMKAKPPQLPLAEVDPKLPERLRLELLEKYGNLREVSDTRPPREAEIWEDWQERIAEIQEQAKSNQTKN